MNAMVDANAKQERCNTVSWFAYTTHLHYHHRVPDLQLHHITSSVCASPRLLLGWKVTGWAIKDTNRSCCFWTLPLRANCWFPCPMSNAHTFYNNVRRLLTRRDKIAFAIYGHIEMATSFLLATWGFTPLAIHIPVCCAAAYFVGLCC